MPNELIWICFAIIHYIFLLIAYRFFGKAGLFVWIGMATVIANIQVLKTVELVGVVATLGNITFGSIFLATDILNENYGKKTAKKAVWMGFFSLLVMMVLMQVVLRFEPHAEDFAQGSLETIFELIPNIAIGSMVAYLCSQYLNVWIYRRIKGLLPDTKYIWVRSNGSTMISQLLDTFIFCSIAFYNVHSFEIWISIFISTYVIKFIVAAMNTPFIYIAKRMQTKADKM
ncbi:queuosine precursor transporter [Gracilibacillus alcaliphilus]|uniref:queuosine precursor transporter n=1 Tax=Gracilibacillus alcaliphilus TaxID=1401441 RepID=UPI0019583B42|nr:queuosine precursor transporter [Gracilibacillus alcaliphilus]MBM7675234.1 putative integral membrane protein (TIGR00697 family) [Gracilibacillus alcaliphilus]